MKYDIIIHGKPNAGSHKATKGLDEKFCENLEEKFFMSMGDIKESECLIVDVRNWKNVWYSVYTFWVGNNIKDTADRPSFFAISIIFPREYFCFVSGVYDILKKVYKEDVTGAYVSKTGKYQINNFSDDTSFEKITTSIKENFVNISEVIDDSFRQEIINNTTACYSLQDCDSKAFVGDLKKYGRVFVSPTFESKDSRLLNTDKYFRDIETKNRQIQSKDDKIRSLSDEVNNLKKQLADKKNKPSIPYKNQIDTLKCENDTLSQEISELKNENKRYQENEVKISELIGAKDEKASSPTEISRNKHSKVKRHLPVINTLLLIFLLGSSIVKFCFSKSSDQPNDKTDTDSVVSDSSDLLSNGNFTQATSSPHEGNMDVDCDLKLFQNGIPINIEDIDIEIPLTIYYKKKDGYQFYTCNLCYNNPEISDDGSIYESAKFDLNKSNQNNVIVIAYRSNIKDECNPKNKLTIK